MKGNSEKMMIRPYETSDLDEMIQLFYDTVHSVNAKDYSPAQLNAWATGKVDKEKWNQSLLEHYTLVAEIDHVIVGFGDIDYSGYLDKLFIHKDYQSIGIAKAIVQKLESYGIESGIACITVHASITAKPFFEKRGYKVIYEQQVERPGVQLTNFLMEKQCSLGG